MPARPQHDPLVKTWLSAVFLMILAMTMIGGITRLTGSGLSMVQWHPLMGALPPLNEAAWAEVFELYKQTPQYTQVNDWMELADFKQIFFWEYLHRLFGRSIGLVVAGPWLVLLGMRRLDRSLALKTLGLIALGGSQGLLGWYMVKSGLVEDPHVSHLRLAAHLCLAFVVAQAVLWVRLGLSPMAPGTAPASRGFRSAVLLTWALVILQVLWGAFMAGTRAGWVSSTFPSMNGFYSPMPWIDAQQGFFASTVFVPGAIHWVHRALAFVVLGACLALAGAAIRRGGALRAPGIGLGTAVLAQFGLGMATVLLSVPIPVAVAHQGMALLLLSTVTWLGHRSLGIRRP